MKQNTSQNSDEDPRIQRGNGGGWYHQDLYLVRGERVGPMMNPNGERCGALRNRDDERRRVVRVIVIVVKTQWASEGVGEWVPSVGSHHEQAMAAHSFLQS